ncbi:DUF6221 family protein [Streptomyces sp. NPDC088731]|uniref:DUF6221 family protein n=1 Tax=Streptomyces sp. NPDC088731 TaxID=3365878 RepID=UPI003830525C
MEQNSEAWGASAQSGLAAFLSARLNEDEDRARRGYYSDTNWERFTTEAHLGAWQAWRQHFPREQWDVKANDTISEAARDAIRERITAHEADRAARDLAEVAVKRRVIEQYESIGNPPPGEFGPDLSRAELGRVLRLLALPYADHPDYKASWRL